MSEWFHVGQKVVCVASGEAIAARLRAFGGKAKYPVHNGIYTIREVRDDTPWMNGFVRKRGDNVVVLLAEIENGCLIGTQPCFRIEPGFDPTGFRPLRKRSTDISCFKEMLSPKKQEVEA